MIRDAYTPDPIPDCPGQLALDAALSDAAARDGMARVDAHADADWKTRADYVIRDLAMRGEPFTSDDVWTLLAGVDENRALGPRMAAASRAGLIVATGEWRLTAQVHRHRAPVRVWRGA